VRAPPALRPFPSDATDLADRLAVLAALAALAEFCRPSFAGRAPLSGDRWRWWLSRDRSIADVTG